MIRRHHIALATALVTLAVSPPAVQARSSMIGPLQPGSVAPVPQGAAGSPVAPGRAASQAAGDKKPARELARKHPLRRSPGPSRRMVRLRSGPGLAVRDPRRAWGTPLAVRRLSQVLAAYSRRFPAAPAMQVHDLSRRGGGRLPPHKSHRAGRDVDLRLALVKPTRRYIDATARTLHVERTWALIRLLFDTGDVQEVLLDRRLQRAMYLHARAAGMSAVDLASILEYPGHRHRKPRPMVIHWRGHRDHMHVRFRVEPRAPGRTPVASR